MGPDSAGKRKSEVVRFYGAGGQGMTVKQVIAQRKKPHLPYLFMVTSKARMGDQFPSLNRMVEIADPKPGEDVLICGLRPKA